MKYFAIIPFLIATPVSAQTVINDGDVNPSNTASAPSLIVGGDTCMGSSSAGAQGIGFGISFGSSWTDKNCVRLKNARQLDEMGYKSAAVQLMCMNDDVNKAMRLAGTPCDKK